MRNFLFFLGEKQNKKCVFKNIWKFYLFLLLFSLSIPFFSYLISINFSFLLFETEINLSNNTQKYYLMLSEFVDGRKKAFSWFGSEADDGDRVLFYYTLILWFLEIISCAMKLNFYSSYNSTLQLSSVGQDLSDYTIILFSLDLTVIILYFFILCSMDRKENACMTVCGFAWVLVYAFRLYYGIYFLYEDSKVETDNTTLESSIKTNVIYEICLDIYMLPPAIVGAFFLLLGALKS